ncbi:hypothetical protein MML48_3g00001192 [Holotrichia oblita]|uniref:Uncharacterized protein n=1 Tax=Holotrichia oblita TaxID=644536 RepID=A0ACB9TD86_HOLOL|nr:hypothetical protein MML48_3g00001192 [Holotrichia oblita]
MKEIKLLDGGFGSQISKRIDRLIDDDVLWSSRLLSTNKAEVINTHLDFLQGLFVAGSNVISTNTYQASIDGFMKHLKLSESESYDLIKEAVDLARKAVSIYKSMNNSENTNILVAGSVGPYGAFLHDGSEYTGSYKDSDGKSIASGEDFQQTVKKCYKMNPDQLLAVGANCIAPGTVEQLFCDINVGEVYPMPLLVYPNSGEFYNKEMGWHGGEAGKPIENYIENWLNMGITWIGGCCRMYAENISKIQQVILKWQMQHSK